MLPDPGQRPPAYALLGRLATWIGTQMPQEVRHGTCSPATESSVCNRKFVDLVSFFIDDVDEPAVPVPSWHDIAALEVACQPQGILTSGGLSRQIKALVIVQDLLAISQTEIVTRHCEWPPPYSAQPYQGARGPSYSTRNLPGSESTAVSTACTEV